MRARSIDVAKAMREAFIDEKKILYIKGESPPFERECFFFDLLSDIFVMHPFKKFCLEQIYSDKSEKMTKGVRNFSVVLNGEMQT